MPSRAWGATASGPSGLYLSYIPMSHIASYYYCILHVCIIMYDYPCTSWEGQCFINMVLCLCTLYVGLEGQQNDLITLGSSYSIHLVGISHFPLYLLDEDIPFTILTLLAIHSCISFVCYYR